MKSLAVCANDVSLSRKSYYLITSIAQSDLKGSSTMAGTTVNKVDLSASAGDKL